MKRLNETSNEFREDLVFKNITLKKYPKGEYLQRRNIVSLSITAKDTNTASLHKFLTPLVANLERPSFQAKSHGFKAMTNPYYQTTI